MLSFFLLIIIFFVLWPLLKAAWRIWMQMRSMRRFMADPAAEMRRRADDARRKAGASSSRSYGTYSTPRRRRKKIPRDVGEYVSFTEVEMTAEERAAASTQTSTSYKTEEQITDIKWVDIK